MLGAGFSTVVLFFFHLRCPAAEGLSLILVAAWVLGDGQEVIRLVVVGFLAGGGECRLAVFFY